MVGYVAGGEYAGNAALGGHAFEAGADADIAVLHVQLALEQVGVGFVADGDEYAGQVHFLGGVVFGAFDAHTGDAGAVAQDFVEGVVPDDLDVAVFGLFKQFVLEDLFGTEAVAAVHQGHFVGNVGEVQSLFHRGVTAANNGNFLLLVEEAVAGGAGGDALAFEFLFRLEAEIHGGGAGSNDQGVAGVLAAIALEAEWAVTKVGFVDGVVDDAGFEAFGVLEHALHELRALNAVVVAGPVVDVGGGGELAADFNTGNQGRVQVGARCVNGSGVTCGAGTEDDQSGMFGVAHWEFSH